MNLSFITKEYTVKASFVKIDGNYYAVQDVRAICQYIIEGGKALVDDMHLRDSLINMEVITPSGESGAFETYIDGPNFAKFQKQIEEEYWKI